MFTTLTPEERATLRRLAMHVAQTCEPTSKPLNVQHVRWFVFGACESDGPSPSQVYKSSVFHRVLDYLISDAPLPGEQFASEVALAAAALFGRSPTTKETP